MYEPYAFLRREDEREQFLYYMLSLDTVDYYPFSRMLTDATLTYWVYIQCSTGSRWAPMNAVTRRGRSSSLFSSGQANSGAGRTPSTNRNSRNNLTATPIKKETSSIGGAWISLQGHLCSSGRLQTALSDYREGVTDAGNQASLSSFQTQNLGMISNVVLGLDSGPVQTSEESRGSARRWFIDFMLIYAAPIGHLY
ncbi:hypothetical protein Ciccas_002063 [Cichlidogyrus casuarinus]|uniref:RUN domain-containing protein n=1 Tax=Cichlidogyrus casuarinus TaxID=1844966 RepID=A0ABD2QIB2_9PLAT